LALKAETSSCLPPKTTSCGTLGRRILAITGAEVKHHTLPCEVNGLSRSRLNERIEVIDPPGSTCLTQNPPPMMPTVCSQPVGRCQLMYHQGKFLRGSKSTVRIVFIRLNSDLGGSANRYRPEARADRPSSAQRNHRAELPNGPPPLWRSIQI
jgi:hypothetical protein